MSSSFLNKLNWPPCHLDSSSNTSITVECKETINNSLFYLYNLIPVMVITFLFALTKKRRTVLLSVLGGRPGVVYPMDSLTRHSKISYACAFGAAAHVVRKAVIDNANVIEYEGHRAVKSFLSIVSMFLYGMTYLPVFLSLTMGSLFGLGLGTLYVWMLTVKELYQLTQCGTDAEGRVLLIFRNLPNLLCLLYLSSSIPLRFARFVYNRRPCFDWTDESNWSRDSQRHLF